MPRVLACVVDAGADGVTCAEVASAAEVGADQWGGNSLLRCSPLSLHATSSLWDRSPSWRRLFAPRFHFRRDVQFLPNIFMPTYFYT